jgi:actin-related protein
MDKVKCPKRDLFTLLVVKVYNLENELNFEADNETLIKNNSQKIIKKYFILKRVKKDWEDIINE